MNAAIRNILRNLVRRTPKQPVVRYFPIEHPGEILKGGASSLERLVYDGRGLMADFTSSDDRRVLRVLFSNVEMYRALDEMPLSLEDEETIGVAPDHLAYRVEDASFWRALPPGFRSTIHTGGHYRFLTGWTCLDVVSIQTPEFALVERPAADIR